MKKKSCENSIHTLVECSVVMVSGRTEELEHPASFKSPVWEHFGFPVKYNDEGKRLVDKTVMFVGTVAQESHMTIETHQAWPRI